jgi:hypothetical protein
MHPQRANAIDKRERWLVMLFLRRYIIWCARRQRITAIRPALKLIGRA